MQPFWLMGGIFILFFLGPVCVNFTQTWKIYTLLVNDRLSLSARTTRKAKHEQKYSEMEALKIRKTPPKKSKRPLGAKEKKKKTPEGTLVSTRCQVPTGRICRAGVSYKACSTNKLPHVRFQLAEFAERECFTRPVLRINCLMSGSNWQNLRSRECFTRPVLRINCLMSVSNWQNLRTRSVLQGLFYE
jgi:hypothetical protein